LEAYLLDADAFELRGKRPAKVLVFADEDAGLADVVQRALIRDRSTRHDRRQFGERRESMAEISAGRLNKTETENVSQ